MQGDGKWKEEILEDDENTTFNSLNIRRVRHSGCDKLLRVKEAYDLARREKHKESAFNTADKEIRTQKCCSHWVLQVGGRCRRRYLDKFWPF